MVQLKMRVIDKSIPWSISKQNKNKKYENEFKCYKCFKIMIVNLWFEDQEGLVKIYGGGPRECSENIHQHCMYLELTTCVLCLLLV